MKTTPIVMAFLLVPVLAHAECVTVENARAHVEAMTYQFSARHARITTLQDRYPLPGVKLFMLRADRQPRFIASTDDHGVAILPKLFPGNYHISAESTKGERSELLLYVTNYAVDDTTSITVNFAVSSLPQSLPESEPFGSGANFDVQKASVTEHLREFKGVLKDPSGAFVLGARVRVFLKAEANHAAIVESRTDEHGRFSAILPEGTYLARIQSPGFRAWFVVFEISKTAESKELEPFLIL